MPWLPFLGVPRLVDAVLQAVGDVSGKTVLDLGCGSGFLSVLMAKRGAARVIGIDVSEDQLEIAPFPPALPTAELCRVRSISAPPAPIGSISRRID